MASSAGSSRHAPTSDRLGIAHVVSAMGWGGMEARTLETARWQADAGHPTVVIAAPESRIFAEAERRGLRAAAVDFGGRDKLASLRQMRRAIRDHGVQVADFHTNRSHAMGVIDLCARVRSQHNLKTKARKTLNKEFPYSRFIATSEAAREALSDCGAVRASRIDVVGEWADERFFAPVAKASEMARLRQRLGVRPDGHVIGACAMMRTDNAFDDLIRATALLRERGVEATCLLVGGPSETRREGCEQERQLRGLARDLGVDDLVQFLGHRCDVPDLFDAMDVAAIVSRHTAQTRVGPEAAARGRPVVGFAVGALGETVREGLTGRLARLGDIYGYASAIERLLRRPAERQEMAENAASFARRNFRQGPKMERTLAVYRQALGQREPLRAAEPGLTLAPAA